MYKIVDLFSGAGGLSLGFTLTNQFEIVGAIDNWKPACETFKFNHPYLDQNSIICADILATQQSGEFHEFVKIWEKKGKVDVVMGGPPCQGMSLAGKRLSDDPRNKLFETFITAVDLLKPKVLIMENVPGLLSMNDGELNKAIIRRFNEIGYNHITDHPPKVLKAEMYGVPQIRRRLFYIAFRDGFNFKEFNWAPPATHYEWVNAKSQEIEFDLFGFNDSKLFKTVSVCEAISDLPELRSGEGSEEIKYPSIKNHLSDFQKYVMDWSTCPDKNRNQLIYNHVAPNNSKELIELISKAAPGDSVDPNYTDSKKWHPDKPGFTVKALGAGGGSTNRRAFHYERKTPRGSTVRENARIQSFPDWYKFLGAKTHQMTQVGNSVPPLLAYRIALEIAKSLS